MLVKQRANPSKNKKEDKDKGRKATWDKMASTREETNEK